jgi:hypothetical protein
MVMPSLSSKGDVETIIRYICRNMLCKVADHELTGSVLAQRRQALYFLKNNNRGGEEVVSKML